MCSLLDDLDLILLEELILSKFSLKGWIYSGEWSIFITKGNLLSEGEGYFDILKDSNFVI